MISVSGELSNLVRMRNSAIGKSAPSLSVHVVSMFQWILMIINLFACI